MNKKVINRILDKYGTPIYIYDAESIKKKHAELQESMSSQIEVFYSIKANPNLAICKFLKNLGCGAEVASYGELFIALEAGYSATDIVFSGPGKSREELEYAILNDIFCINVESIDEAVLINQIATTHSKNVKIALRINPDFKVKDANIKMSGIASQFGIDYTLLDYLFKILHTLTNVKVIGFDVYMGTQILNSESILNNIENIIQLAIDLSENYNLEVKYLDIGGGFGIPYFAGENPLDMDKMARGIKIILMKYKDFLSGVRVITESGRFLMAESGVYITKILYKKKSNGETFLVCDGGSNQHAASAFLGRFIRNNFPIKSLHKNKQSEVVTIVGPLCTPTDIIGQKLNMTKSNADDYIIIENAGAYGLTNSPILFLSHNTPAEVFFIENQIHIIREHGKPEELVRGQHCPF